MGKEQNTFPLWMREKRNRQNNNNKNIFNLVLNLLETNLRIDFLKYG